MLKKLTLLALVFAVATPAFASSDDAWSEFATKVQDACLAATTEILTDARAVVDPFGSESYGLAVITGKVDATTTKSIVCVFNKQTEAVEIGGELDIPAAE
ncbi:hypothetical protein VW35_12735 [Devosia soli]|uniref:Uncharacterized protein n=1 Tax=Devosia soli TaxID=361041 RepID=A0A0F5L6Z6_9HYPH|nr:hypothetical protein [Devosia soli]KKB77984.1 hypothetical protein VW35_12735 [Devosia soli]